MLFRSSARVYKPAHSHEKALSMILNGECGAFQPLLLECLVESSDIVQREMAVDTVVRSDQRAAENTAVEVAQYEELSTTDRTLRILEQERVIHQFFKELSQDILFEYATTPPMLALSAQGVRRLGLEAATVDPYHNKQVQEMVDLDRLAELSQLLQSTTPVDAVDALMLRAVIAVQPADVFHQADAPDIQDEDQDAHHALDDGQIGRAHV